MPLFPKIFIILALSLGIYAQAHAQVTVVGTGYQSESNAPDFVGAAASPFYWDAEVFTVPTNGNDVLESLTVWYNNRGFPTTTAENSLYAWDGTETVGTALFSGTQAVPSSSVDAVTYNDLALNLTPGATYLFTAGSSDLSSPGHTAAYSDYTNTTSLYGEAGGYTGTYGAMGYSIDFSASFGPDLTPVPERSTLVWGGVALFAALAFMQFRRQQRPELGVNA